MQGSITTCAFVLLLLISLISCTVADQCRHSFSYAKLQYSLENCEEIVITGTGDDHITAFEDSLPVTRSVTIIHSEGGVFDLSAQRHSLFVITGENTIFTLKGMIFSNYAAGFAQVAEGASINIEDSQFSRASLDKGAVFLVQGSPRATFTNVRFSDHSGASYYSIDSINSEVIINECEFSNNAKGIDIDDFGTVRAAGGSLSISNSRFDHNSAHLGGAIYVSSMDFLGLNGVTFVKTQGYRDFGVYVVSAKRAQFHEISFEGADVRDDQKCLIQISQVSAVAFTQANKLPYPGEFCIDTPSGERDPAIIVYDRQDKNFYQIMHTSLKFIQIDHEANDQDSQDPLYCQYCTNEGICERKFVDCSKQSVDSFSDCNDLTIRNNVPTPRDFSSVCANAPADSVIDNLDKFIEVWRNVRNGAENFFCIDSRKLPQLSLDSFEAPGWDHETKVHFFGGESGVIFNMRSEFIFQGSASLFFYNIHIKNCGPKGCIHLTDANEFIFFKSSIANVELREQNSAIYLHSIHQAIYIEGSRFSQILSQSPTYSGVISIDHFIGNGEREASFQILDTTFSQCSQSEGNGQGGAVSIFESNSEEFFFRNVNFEECSAHRGGALYFENLHESPVRIENSLFTNCHVNSDGKGSAIFLHTNGHFELYNTQFISNQKTSEDMVHLSDSGIVHVEHSSFFSVFRSQFWYNQLDLKHNFVSIFSHEIASFFGNLGHIMTYPIAIQDLPYHDLTLCVDYCQQCSHNKNCDRRIACNAVVASIESYFQASTNSVSSRNAILSSSSYAAVSLSSKQAVLSSSANNYNSMLSSSEYHASVASVSSSSMHHYAVSSASAAAVSSSSVHHYAVSSASAAAVSSSSVHHYAVSSASAAAVSSSSVHHYSASAASVAAASVSSVSAVSISAMLEDSDVSPSLVSAWSVSSAAAYARNNSNDKDGVNSALIGGAVGGALLLLLLLVLIILLLRRNRKLKKEVSQSSQPRGERSGSFVGFSSGLHLNPHFSADDEPTYQYIGETAGAPRPPSMGPATTYDVLKPPPPSGAAGASTGLYSSLDEVTYANANFQVSKAEEALLPGYA